MIYDLIFSKADDCYLVVPRGEEGALSLKTIYERTQCGTSGLHASVGISKKSVEDLIGAETGWRGKFGIKMPRFGEADWGRGP